MCVSVWVGGWRGGGRGGGRGGLPFGGMACMACGHVWCEYSQQLHKQARVQRIRGTRERGQTLASWARQARPPRGGA